MNDLRSFVNETLMMKYDVNFSEETDPLKVGGKHIRSLMFLKKTFCTIFLPVMYGTYVQFIAY